MSKTKIAKIITVLILIFILIGSVPVYARQDGPTFTNPDRDRPGGSSSTGADPFENPGSWEPPIEDDPEITERAGKVLGIINAMGVIVALVVLVGIGIKFMLGSVEEKAEYKKTLVPYIIGVFLLVGVTTVVNIIYTLTNSVL